MSEGETVNKCPLGCSEGFSPFIDLGRVAVSGQYMTSDQDPIQHEDLAFDYCTSCSLIQRRLSKGPPMYRDNNRPTNHQYPNYLNAVLSDLFDGRELRFDHLCLEVGCNDGGLLEKLESAYPFHPIGMEPSIKLAEQCQQKGFRVYPEALQTSFPEEFLKKSNKVDTLICRHVLEHTETPQVFLDSLRRLISPQGKLLLEVPDGRGVLEHGLIHELWDEHLFHFTPDNLSCLLSCSGFEVETLKTFSHRGGRNIVIKAKLEQSETERRNHFVALESYQSDEYHDRYLMTKDEWIKASMKWEGPVYALGASHPQWNFLRFHGLSNRIEALVDDDPFKIGKKVPFEKMIPILSSERMFEDPPKTLLLTAFGCDGWMNKVRQGLLGTDCQVIEVSPGWSPSV